MRNFLLGCALLATFAGCQNEKSDGSLESRLDLSDTLIVDSFEEADCLPGHPEPDGTFDEFINRFMVDSLLQRDRIVFPLRHKVDGEVSQIAKSEWRYDSIYVVSDEYTVVHDGREMVDRSQDTLIRKATLERIDLRLSRVKLYHFRLQDEHWMLQEIDEHDFDSDNNHDFFSFYGQFAHDEEFQQEHVRDPFLFKTFDSDNFQEIEGWVSAEQWPDYRTELPAEAVTNTIYNDERPTSDYRTFVMSSPSSGMNFTLVFKRSRGSWQLISMEN